MPPEPHISGKSGRIQKDRKPRVFSGVQPSGQLHIGNYIGALGQWVRDQKKFDNIFCVVDLHALTIPESVDPKKLRAKTREVAALYVACGIDPDENAIIIQSHIKEHAELAWILNCVTPVGWLERMTQFKSKSKGGDSVGTGLLDYPVLQAADILLYQTDLVPVGEDQRQHIELARDIVQRFNNMFGEVLALPSVKVPEKGARILGLDDPTQKMSKSIGESRPGHSIGLLDTPNRIRKSIMSAVTDSNSEVRFDQLSPGLVNLLTIYQSLTGASGPETEREFAGKRYSYLKEKLAETVMAAVGPVQNEFRRITDDQGYIEAVLRRGVERVLPIAQDTIARVKSVTGIG